MSSIEIGMRTDKTEANPYLPYLRMRFVCFI